MASILSAYSRALNAHPLITKCLTSVVLGCSGDIAAQRIMSKDEHFKADWGRVFRMGFVCMCYGGINHYWYNFLQQSIKLEGMQRVLAKMAFDQLFFVPVFDSFMFFGLSALEDPHGQPSAGIRRVKACLWNTLKVNYCVWPFLQIINFKYVPLQYQVFFTTVGVFFWNIFLSDMANRRGKQAAAHIE